MKNVIGWIQKIRDHGGMTFYDLRQKNGEILQCISKTDLHVGLEYVVEFYGELKPRPMGTENTKLSSGTVEFHIDDIKVLSECKELPIPITFSQTEYPEQTRLKYRYLDLRREELQTSMRFRNKFIKSVRDYFYDNDFQESQTPILTTSSPEGARDFVVPARLFPNKYYALPQAPQIYKQLIMCSGFDKYFQIAPCFRDESGRSDRSPGEFYQIDMEMSFVKQEDVFTWGEQLMNHLFSEFGKYEHNLSSIEKIPYKTAISEYGTDKPDLRVTEKIYDVSKYYTDSEHDMVRGKHIKILRLTNLISTRELKQLSEDMKIKYGTKGFFYLKSSEDGISGSFAKFMNQEMLQRYQILSDCQYPTFIITVDDFENDRVQKMLGYLRTEENGGNKNQYKFCWITDFPMFERDEEGNIGFAHNPFSMPQNITDSVDSMLAYQYDMVCNGYEIASGAIRNHNVNTMEKIFELAGYTTNDLKQKFSSLYEAFQYGPPPHGGMALGVERLLMILLNKDNIKDVILFPMMQTGEDVLMGGPSDLTDKQKKELKIT